MLKKEIKEKILKNAIYLEEYGINELAWTKENAKNIIQEIIEDKIGVLGGDVYKLSNNHLEPLSDNWACEPNVNESKEEYFFRSKLESLRYIEEYPLTQGENIIFSITFTEKMI